jgi:hypothetical protein
MLVGHASAEERFRPYIVAADLRRGYPRDFDGELVLVPLERSSRRWCAVVSPFAAPSTEEAYYCEALGISPIAAYAERIAAF